MIDLELYAKSLAFRNYTRFRKVEDYNRNHRFSAPKEVCIYFADLNRDRFRKLEEEYPDFRETYDRREEEKNAHQR